MNVLYAVTTEIYIESLQFLLIGNIITVVHDVTCLNVNMYHYYALFYHIFLAVPTELSI